MQAIICPFKRVLPFKRYCCADLRSCLCLFHPKISVLTLCRRFAGVMDRRAERNVACVHGLYRHCHTEIDSFKTEEASFAIATVLEPPFTHVGLGPQPIGAILISTRKARSGISACTAGSTRVPVRVGTCAWLT